MSSKSSDSPGASPQVDSPCRRQCCLDERDICLGCGRTLAEILEWGQADSQRRRAICTAAEARVQQRPGFP